MKTMVTVKSGEPRNEKQKLMDELEIEKCKNENMKLVLKAILRDIREERKLILNSLEEE